MDTTSGVRDDAPGAAGADDRSTVTRSGGGPGPRLVGAGTLIGHDVHDRHDEAVGDIREIVLDTSSGRVAYAVLAVGGVLGLGAKLYAVPWGALSPDPANRRFVLDVARERLQDAPGFDADRWPDMADETWARDVHAFYGTPHDASTGTRHATADVDAIGARDGTASLESAQPNDGVPTPSPTNRTGLTPDSIPID